MLEETDFGGENLEHRRMLLAHWAWEARLAHTSDSRLCASCCGGRDSRHGHGMDGGHCCCCPMKEAAASLVVEVESRLRKAILAEPWMRQSCHRSRPPLPRRRYRTKRLLLRCSSFDDAAGWDAGAMAVTVSRPLGMMWLCRWVWQAGGGQRAEAVGLGPGILRAGHRAQVVFRVGDLEPGSEQPHGLRSGPWLPAGEYPQVPKEGRVNCQLGAGE